MTFVQVIDYETKRFDEMNALIDRWAEQSSGKRTATHTMIGQDREARNHYVDMVEFASYEDAMKNSHLPETDRMFQQMVALCEGMPKFMNLDVVRDEHLNKQLVNRVFQEAVTDGNMSVLDECFAANYIDHDASKEESTVVGRDGMRSDMQTWRAAFDMNFEPVAQVCEGDFVTTVWNWRGTQKGEFMGVASTGKTYEMSGTTTFRILNGEIAEGWWHYNPGQLQREMGGSGSPYGS
ncbi:MULTISPECIES: ester cyclase [unclassified Streptomyces]|uniref:ester cyclase n=1 Tax=unclassified Streptomyces TaxID=2593676 RepID=UPI0022512029|nr:MULTISPECIES: ester cyclase [unclassified Streptomyces]MCX4527592.1 ester cyclase [Streptomyces sp. NBC_01551]MCX4541810.1 ester cyclase [Streptomyces sp. NBC_01565]